MENNALAACYRCRTKIAARICHDKHYYCTISFGFEAFEFVERCSSRRLFRWFAAVEVRVANHCSILDLNLVRHFPDDGYSQRVCR